MRIRDMIVPGEQFVSLEFFPPKEKEAWPRFFDVVGQLKKLDPLFVSVTYGAGGSTQAHTLEIVSRIKKEFDLEPMAHLTCVGADRKSLHGFLDKLAAAGIDNVLALRGDPPKGESEFVPDSEEFRHACDLVTFIRSHYPQMGVGVAGYPEGHVEAADKDTDLQYLKEKLDKGGDFVITQLFFDNQCYFDFVDRARAIGIEAPIIPGILPIMNLKVITRIASLCGAAIPESYLSALKEADAAGGNDAVSRVGIRHAAEQVKGLLKGGVPGVHLYTLNKAQACREIVESVQGM